jgi:enoyl-CoA hydratase/carnithine racemase
LAFNTLSYDIADGVLTVTLNRPDQLNAFTVEMANELEQAFNQASEDDAIGAVVVTGAGRAFCAGMDLSKPGNVFGLNEELRPTLADMRDRMDEPGIAHGVRDTGGRVTMPIFNCKKPVIAAINGPAVGIGATMTCAMDVRLASTKARIGFVFGRLGIVPEGASTWFLPRIVGLPTALEWILSADILTAEEAHAGGFVKSVHEPEELLPAAYALAEKFVRNRSRVAVALSRQMLYRNSALRSPLEAHQVESLAMFYSSVGDGKEGVKAFLEKRDAAFTGKASELPPYPWWE